MKTRKHKEIFSLILITVVMFALVGCSSKENSLEEESYSKEFDDLLNVLNKMNKSSDGVCEMTYYFISEDGASDGMAYLAAALTVTSAEDVGKTPDSRCMASSMYNYLGIDDSDMSSSENVMEYGMRTGSYERVYEKCSEIQEQYRYLVKTSIRKGLTL